MFIFFLHSSFSSFFFLSLSLCPFSFTPCFCLLALIIIMVTAKGYFLTISTVGNNGHFILGGEGYGQPWWSTPSPLSLTEGSSFRLVLAFGTARQEGFLLMCLSFTKGCFAVVSRLFLRAQCTERRHCTRQFFSCTFSLMCDMWTAGKCLCCCYLLLFEVLCLRKKVQVLKKRQKPASLPFSLSIFLFQLEYILQVIKNSTVADFHLMVVSPIRR